MEYHDHVLDYLKWRGDLSFREAEFNEIDAMICAELSYVNMEGIVPPVGQPSKVTIGQLYESYEQRIARHEPVNVQAHEMRFLLAMGRCRRYKDIVLSDYSRKVVDVVDGENAMQFGAVCIHIHRFLYYVAFQGTDEALVGWKENLNMIHQFPVPSQIEAKNYLNALSKGFFRKYYIGGHSKGGNLAKYASAFCDGAFQKRIQRIYCFDAPGFTKNMMEYPEYARINERIIALIPQGSVVGTMLEHAEGSTIIHSQGLGISQHDLESWSVNTTGFIRAEERDAESYRLEAMMTRWITSFSKEELARFSQIFCEMVTNAGVRTFPELMSLHPRTVFAILKEMKNVPNRDKEIVYRVLKSLLVEKGKDKRRGL